MASFFKKVGRQISNVVDKMEAEASKRILAKYPDINDVLELLKEKYCQAAKKLHTTFVISFGC